MAHKKSTRRMSGLLHLTEFKFDGSGTTEDENRDLQPAFLVIDFLDYATEVGERAVDDAPHHAHLEQAYPPRLLRASTHAAQHGLGLALTDLRPPVAASTAQAHQLRHLGH